MIEAKLHTGVTAFGLEIPEPILRPLTVLVAGAVSAILVMIALVIFGIVAASITAILAGYGLRILVRKVFWPQGQKPHA
ncbi:MAG: hypothetical protein KGI60_01040 [Patescibacteria group bacterium]|nr:hypothetical protein [Patescibacteria group bacterium]